MQPYITLLIGGVSEELSEFPILYARSKNGNIRTYLIEVVDFEGYSLIRTTKKANLQGKEVVDETVVNSGVNLGKANATTYQEQARLQAHSMYKRLLDAGFTPTIPTEHFNTDAEGKIKPMLAISFNEKKIKFPCIVQPKYDGVRCLITFDKGVQIFSRKGKPYNIPHLKKWAEEHRELLPLDGELYNHGELTFQEIVSAVKKQSEITPLIRYVVYDKPTEGTNKERWESLQKEFPNEDNSPAYLSGSIICHSMVEIWCYHEKCVSQGYEGVIIRNLKGTYEKGFRSSNLIKLKVFNDAEFKITDVIEASGRDAGTAIFVCECKGGYFNVKPQGTRELRKEYFDNQDKLIGKMVTVQYQGLSDEGIPRFPSAITIRDYE